ncbi:response regulator [filamentous cyanobacterium CCP1]|jgi:chemotaxis family two-component system response regulator Rcp1|nr:response regulator [filamentous cyanobacterium CCP2]PSB61141.1 response regulator [filamentous cyanobacterium CCP1]
MDEGIRERLILVIENNLNHAQLIETVLKDHPASYQVVTVEDGVQAMDFLHQRGSFAQALRPHLILLDLNLPNKDGRTVLAEIKADACLKRIPIVVLTASTNTEDVFTSYAVQGNCYVVKADDFNTLSAIVKRIEEFWLEIVTLPSE